MYQKTFLKDKSLKFYLEIMLEELQDNHLSVSLITDKRGDRYKKLRMVDTMNSFWYQTYCHTFSRKTKSPRSQAYNHNTIINRTDTASLLTMLIKRGHSHANPEKVHWLIEEADLLKKQWEQGVPMDNNEINPFPTVRLKGG